MFSHTAVSRSRAATLLTALLAAFVMMALPPHDAARASSDELASLPFAAGIGGSFGFADLGVATGAEAASDGVTAPTIVPRSEWDPAGDCPFVGGSRSTPERVQLHHTHIPVVHAPDETPAAMQSICRTHRDRFADFGYHYAIDPYGRIWQGRGPMPEDMTPDVREGAHAQGFNERSMGVALIGDFDEAPPSPEAIEATVELLAFLADTYDMDPGSTVGTESTGGSATRFPEGTHVELPAIAGHRDTGSNTSCPGEHLYELLPELRQAVAERLAA